MKKHTKILTIAVLVMLFVVSCTLIACKKEYTVTFETGIAGVTAEAQIVEEGQVATQPDFAGYEVLGWYSDSACTTPYDFATPIAQDTTLYCELIKGEGTAQSPFEIGGAKALALLTNAGKEVNYVAKLVADFTYPSADSATYAATTFNGTLEGNGHVITLGPSNTGIFYKLGANAQVKDIKIVGHIDALVGSCGVLANHNYGLVSNITTEGTEVHLNSSGKISNGFANGIYSLNGTVGTKADALATDTADAIAGAGGIVGTNYKGATVKDCLNRMNVRAVVGGGGIAAVNYGTIEHCFNDGCVGTTGDTVANMTATYDFSYLGGMAGLNYGVIKQCGNLNKVYAHRLPWLYEEDNKVQNYRMNIGGIAGDNVAVKEGDTLVGGIITECFSYGRIHGDARVGGIAGQSNGSITYCAAYGYFGARLRLGGIVGYQRDEDPGIVDSCSAMFRVKSGTSSTAPIKDSNGVEHEVIPLDDGKVSENTNTIVDYYCLSKYATNSTYHNNCGNFAPIDPATGDKGSNGTTKGAELFNAFERLTSDGNTAWALDDTDKESYTTNNLIPLSGSYQIYLNVYLSWQKATITAVGLDGAQSTVDAMQGINYSQAPLIRADGKWDKDNSNRNMSGYIVGLPAQTAPSGKVVIWTTVKDDASTQWDGICRGDVTLYAMLVDAPAEK